MSITHSFITRISEEHDLKHYARDTLSRFLYEKDGLVLISEVYPESEKALRIEAFIGGGSISLDWERARSFCADIKKIIRTQPLPVEIHDLSDSVANLFIRGSIGFLGIPNTDDWNEIFITIRDFIDEFEAIRGILDSYRRYDYHSKELSVFLDDARRETDKNKKGEILEKMMKYLIENDDNLRVYKASVDTASEEIDLVAENDGITPFFRQLQSAFILVECKNWTSKVGAKEVRDFAQKIQNRPLLCKVGCLVTTSTLTKSARNELLGYRGKDFIVCTMEGVDLDSIARKSVRFSHVLEEKIKEGSLR